MIEPDTCQLDKHVATLTATRGHMADDDDFFATQKSVEEPKAKRVRLKTYDLVHAKA